MAYQTASGLQLVRGSGTLITPQFLITAAHNLSPAQEIIARAKITENRPRRISFMPGAHNNKTKFPVIPLSYAVHEKWVQYESPGYDYAVIRLDRDIGRQIGHASLRALPEEELNGTRVNVTGYPGDFKEHPQMYTMEGRIKHISKDRVFYSIDTSPGQSGSGVWKFGDEDEKDDLICCGVHAYGGRLNSAVRITDSVVDQVRRWIIDLHKKDPVDASS